MTRLDQFITRLTAQRAVLAFAARALAGVDGPVLELGLGNGRTFDHLRALFPDRRIIAFDRALAAHKTCEPDPADLVLGEIATTARAFAGHGAALVHADIGTGYADKDAEIIGWLGDVVAPLLKPGGLAASGLPLVDDRLSPLPLPADAPPNGYFLYRRVETWRPAPQDR